MNSGAFLLGIALVFGIASAPVSAQSSPAEDDTIDFAVEQDVFSLTLPSGFCLPQGREGAIARQLDAGDSQNVTPVNIQACGTFGQNYILIKSPRSLPRLPLDKDVFLGILATELQKQENLDAGIEGGTADLNRIMGEELQVDVGTIRYAGTDEECVYMIGTISVTNAQGQSSSMQIGSCGTLVGERHLFVHSYARPDLGPSHAELMERSKQVALAITPQ